MKCKNGLEDLQYSIPMRMKKHHWGNEHCIIKLTNLKYQSPTPRHYLSVDNNTLVLSPLSPSLSSHTLKHTHTHTHTHKHYARPPQASGTKRITYAPIHEQCVRETLHHACQHLCVWWHDKPLKNGDGHKSPTSFWNGPCVVVPVLCAGPAWHPRHGGMG